MNFDQAIVRRPCRNFIHGITTSASLGRPDYELALKQHLKYVEALEKCGLKVRILEPDENFPDSVFVEDTALLTSSFAVITNPGAPSRRGETEGMLPVLKKFFDRIERINVPGTLEAGDVMMAESHFFIGVSERTNSAGADQLISILNKYGFTGSKIELKNILHLKTGVSYLGDNTLLVIPSLADETQFRYYKKIIIDNSEAYAANSLRINDIVLMPGGFSGTKKKIEKEGFKTASTDVSEFRKLDGGLSCLSLRF